MKDAVPPAVEQKRLKYFSNVKQIETVQITFGLHFISTMKLQVTCSTNCHVKTNALYG